MENIISVLVVIVFLVIVFRKRLAPLIRGRKKPEQEDIVESVSCDGIAHRDKVKVYFSVFAINAGAYLDADSLSEAIDLRLHKALSAIYSKYVDCEFSDLDVVINGDLLLFLIRWHT